MKSVYVCRPAEENCCFRIQSAGKTVNVCCCAVCVVVFVCICMCECEGVCVCAHTERNIFFLLVRVRRNLAASHRFPNLRT